MMNGMIQITGWGGADCDEMFHRHTLQLIVDQKNKLLIRAPITGIVKGLDASVGSVVSPAASIMEIIPSRFSSVGV